MSSATRKRNRTWRTAPATAHRRSSASGSETSCTQRGTPIRMLRERAMRAMVPTASDGLRKVL